ncbi:MAG: CotH kinase family protein [Muribaculaceae bacterium]|nr:CotH kinase family protein [Muribaculaceae bacterium]
MRPQAYLPLLLLMIASAAFAQRNISYYRNDGKFNQVKIDNSTAIRHSVSGSGEASILADDWIEGEVDIPLTALDSCVLKPTDIPTLRLAFTDYPDVDCLWEKALYLAATLDVEGNGYTEDAEGLSLQVKGRGNTSWVMPKKPMRLKFPKKTSICGLRKAKNFVLLNNYLDPSLMRNALAMWLAQKLEVPYANTIVPCNVFINGHYAGSYTLTEKVGINGASVDIDESTGILFELSKEYDEKYKFKSPIYNLPVMVKDPDFDELYEENPEGLTPEARLAMWQEDFNKAENLASLGRGFEAFDLASVVNYTLVFDMFQNSEIGHPKSMYIFKRSLEEGEKYYFGPAWDFDVSANFANEDQIVRNPNGGLWMNKLMKQLALDPEYKAMYAQRVAYLVNDLFPEFLAYFDQYALTIEASAKLNGLRWPYTGVVQGWAYAYPSFDTTKQVNSLREWLIARADYLRKSWLE